jgi:hypothetical protein
VSTPDSDHRRTLELIHEDIVVERDRLRSARASITSQLGPLPASAGIVIGLVAALDHRVQRGYFIAATVLFALVILVSIRYSRLPPYRLLRGRLVLGEGEKNASPGCSERRRRGERDDAWANLICLTAAERLNAAEWLSSKVALERRIYGPPRSTQPLKLKTFFKRLTHSWAPGEHLQSYFDVELTALNVVQGLFASIVLVLLAGVIAG